MTVGSSFWKKGHCICILWCIFMGRRYNDPWVESYMWRQQTWGQRSSRGQWPLVQVFGKKGQCIHILWCIFKSIKYYNDCKSMWSRKQARHVVRELHCWKKKRVTESTYFDIFSWDFDTMILGRGTQVTSTEVWGQRSSWVIDLLVKFFWKIVTVSTYFDVLPWELDTMIPG